MNTIMKCCVLLLLPAFPSTHAMAQALENDTTTTPFISEVFLFGGGMGQRQRHLAKDELSLLAPGSSLLDRDFTGYDYSGTDFGPASGLFTLGVGLNLFRHSTNATLRRSPLRIGFSFAEGSSLSSVYRRSVSAPYDTLVSTTTGEVFTYDTTHYSYYFVHQNSQRFGLDAALLFRSRDFGRFSFYGGPGIELGVVFNARTTVEHVEGVDVRGPYAHDLFENAGHSTDAQEEYDNGGSAYAAFHLTIGCDYRMGTRSIFWRHVHVFSELSPMLRVDGYPGLDKRISNTFRSTFGLRVTLDT